MPYKYRCPLRESKSKRGVEVQCKFCEPNGEFLTVLNHNHTGIKCAQSSKDIFLDFEGVSFENMPQEYLPELNKGKAKLEEENE